MPKNNRNGQAAILTNGEYSKIRHQIRSQKYKLFLDLAWYTGERWGALCQLKVADLYNSDGSVREYVTFRAQTRKASVDGSRKTRQVPIHLTLQEALKAYQPDNPEWMFSNGLGNHICLRNADLIFRSAIDRAGLGAKGISTHSTRRTFITKLHQAGVDLYTIQKITGHQDLKSLGRYVEIDSDRVKGAIAIL
jgi:integrase/recombinase XerD